MESLVPEKQRPQRILGVIDSHTSTVNCVRWNYVGTLFASSSDDGIIALWEYKGEMVAGAFQKSNMQQANSKGMFEERKGMMFDNGGAKATGEEEDEQEILEEWRQLRKWNHHSLGVLDVAWCPDNIHFASCGNDSQIMVFNINEMAPIWRITEKANGLAFDPFCKFMASQSTEDKSLKIWRIQENYTKLTKEKEIGAYYQNSKTSSMFRRLSWSTDGKLISTSAGKIGHHESAPLISRSNWELQAALSGHGNVITCSRFNPNLYKVNQDSGKQKSCVDEEQEVQCESIVALGSADSTITIWKPSMSKPFAVFLDIFKNGVADLTWGFNGNLLLASSLEGKVFIAHFKDGLLGEPLDETQK